MKKTFLLSVIFLLTLNVYSQDILREFKRYYQNKEFQEAYHLLPNLIKEKYKDEMLYIAFGDVYFEFEKYDSARIMYEIAYDIRDDKPEVIQKLARAFSYTNSFDKAIKLLKDYLKKNSDEWQTNLELGYIYLRADSLRQAEYYFTKVKELNKKTPEPFIALGDLYFAQKVYELARWNYEEALSLNPDLTEARVKLATSYYYLAMLEQDPNLYNELFLRSLKEWQIVSQKDPKNAKAWFEQGKILYLASRYEDASRAFYQFVQLRPSSSLGRWYLAQSLVEIGKCDSAIVHLEIVINEIDSVRTKAQLKLARCYFDTKNFEKAIQTYSILSRTTSLEEKDYERFATAYIYYGDTISAFNVYDELFKKNNLKCSLIIQVALFSMNAKYYDRSINYFKLVQKNCNDSTAQRVNFNLGYVFLMQKSFDSAIVYFNRSIQFDSINPISYIYRGDAFASLNNKKSAKSDYLKAIQIVESNSEKNQKYISVVFAKISSLLVELKDYQELNKYARRWTELDQNNPNAWIYLAISYQGSKDLPNACKSWKKVKQLEPNNKFAIQYLKELNCE
ncbi:MAG: tetratricopeptide repeat protein [Candidatus Kapaibacteriales bacterium]